jgi:class 3 adenylate cyclase/tetratricopeptide (TPR) repeat protein
LTDQPTIDELLDRAVGAINSGDRATADALAEQVLAVDQGNTDAEDLLASPVGGGELRRLTMLFADLVDSTALSTRVDPEIYRTVVGRYRDEVIKIVKNYDGHLGSTKGDGLLAVFGHPRAHENDAHRAVHVGLDVTREVRALSARVRRRFGFDIDVRIGIHRGLIYLDLAQDDVYGLGANLAARICGLAEPGTVAVSQAIERVARDQFDMELRPPQTVKGVDEPIVHYRVLGEREVAGSSSGPLVGRDAELAELKDQWASALSGQLGPMGVLLRGEGGIGKSRLARATVELATDSGAVVLGLFGSPFHTDVGLRPVRRLLERRSGILRDSDPKVSLAKLSAEVERCGMDSSTIAPLLAPVIGVAPGAGYEPASADASRLYDRIGRAVADYLLACIGDRPGLILAEDVQWFDEDTIEVLRTLLSEARGRLMLVVTGRSIPDLPGTTRTLDLEPLTDDATDELIAALHPEISSAARRTVQRRCDGIPLYIEEVVAKLKELPSDSAELAQVPDTLYEALIARLRSIKSAHQIVEAGALMRGRIDRDVVSAVVDVAPEEVGDVLNELVRVRVMEPIGVDSWRFHHELLREAAAELMPPTVRRRLHSRIADVLASSAAQQNPEWLSIASHYEEAARFDEAHAAYRMGAANARQRGALNEARTHLNRALACLERAPAGGARDKSEVAVRLERGFLASTATGHASSVAATDFERCLQLIGDEPSEALFATFSALWSYYATRGDLHRANQLVEALQQRLDDMPPWYRAATNAVLGSLAVFRGDFVAGREMLEHAMVEIEHMDPVEIEGAWFAPNDPVAGMYTFVGFTRFIQGDLEGANSAFVQMKSRCETLAFPHGPFTLCFGHSTEALVRSEAAQYEGAAALVAEIAGRSTRFGFSEWQLVADCAQTSALIMASIAMGERRASALDAHAATLTELIDRFRASHVVSFRAWYDAALVRVLLAAGKMDAARDHIDLALKLADETNWHMYDSELLRLRAHTFTDVEAIRRGLLTALESARAQGAPVFELRTAADAYVLTGEPARAAFEEVLARFPASQSWPELDRFRAMLT